MTADVAATAEGPLRLALPRRPRGGDRRGAPPVASADAAPELVFEGTLTELAHALRTQRLRPAEVDLLRVVRVVLARFDAFAARDLDLATDALPAAATVIELKARLLLPRPPRPPDEDAETAEREAALAAVAALEALEDAIVELRARRERRRHLLPARATAPAFPRRPRPLGIAPARLAELAARLRPGGYFEIARDRLTVSAAIERIAAWLRPGRRRPLREALPDEDWGTRTVYFAGALELVRDGRCRLWQERAFGPIEVEGRDGDARGPVVADADGDRA